MSIKEEQNALRDIIKVWQRRPEVWDSNKVAIWLACEMTPAMQEGMRAARIKGKKCE